MKFIDTSKLNKLHEEFENQSQNRNFQKFVEGVQSNGNWLIIDTRPVEEYLKALLDKDYKYLMQCEEEGLRWFGDEYLERVNFWRSLLDDKEQLTIPEVKAERRRLRIGLELIELKTDGSFFEFIFHETVRNKILSWGWLPGVDAFKEYLQKNAFPEDKLYSEQQFLNDVEHESSLIRLKVERPDTADFIRKMFYELFEI